MMGETTKPHFKPPITRTMSLQQQVKKLTRSIRQQKDRRQRLRQVLLQQKKIRDHRVAHVEDLRQQLNTQELPATIMDWAKLVRTYVFDVLGCDTTTVGHRQLGLYIQWSHPCMGEDREQHHCVYVEPGGAAVNLNLDRAGNCVGGGNDFHVANDPVKDWPLP